MLSILAKRESATVQELTALLGDDLTPRGWRTVQGMLGASAAQGWARKVAVQGGGSKRWEITAAGRAWLARQSERDGR
jgi:hypothetical protein